MELSIINFPIRLRRKKVTAIFYSLIALLIFLGGVGISIADPGTDQPLSSQATSRNYMSEYDDISVTATTRKIVYISASYAEYLYFYIETADKNKGVDIYLLDSSGYSSVESGGNPSDYAIKTVTNVHAAKNYFYLSSAGDWYIIIESSGLYTVYFDLILMGSSDTLPAFTESSYDKASSQILEPLQYYAIYGSFSADEIIEIALCTYASDDQLSIYIMDSDEYAAFEKDPTTIPYLKFFTVSNDIKEYKVTYDDTYYIVFLNEMSETVGFTAGVNHKTGDYYYYGDDSYDYYDIVIFLTLLFIVGIPAAVIVIIILVIKALRKRSSKGVVITAGKSAAKGDAAVASRVVILKDPTKKPQGPISPTSPGGTGPPQGPPIGTYSPAESPPPTTAVPFPEGTGTLKEYCPFCGAELDDFMDFCPNCGSRVK